MPQTLDTIIFRLKPLLCLVFGIYAFISSYPGSFTSTYAHAQQDVACKSADESLKIISWTGDCVNGLLEGDGEMVYEFITEGKTVSSKVVSKFQRGASSGVRYIKVLVDDGLYWTMLDVGNVGKSIATSSKKPSDDVYNQYWYDYNDHDRPNLSFDEALKRKVAQAKQLNRESIDPYILKEYLLGRYKFTKAVSQTSSNSSELESHEDGTDDAKVFGGGSSPKTRKNKR